MLDKLLHTPEGVRDIYNLECKKKLVIQDQIHWVLHKYGYNDIQTPVFEYYEVFNHEKGTIQDKEMIKFIDRYNNILALRPDITPSIARAAAKYYNYTDMPIRFCYLGNTYRNNENYQGKLVEFTQQGVELIGDESVEADAEIIALAIQSLLATGLSEFQIDIGQVEFFKGIIEEAGIDKETEQQLRLLIDEKNFFGLEELISKQNLSESHKQMILKLPKLFGSVEILEEAKKITTNKRAIEALERLENVYKILCYYGVEEYITFDLGMVTDLDYYTGVIFKGYTYGTGVAIVGGGRYDKLVSQFGKDSEAIGFAIFVDEVIASLNRQNKDIKTYNTDTLIIYEDKMTEFAIQLAEQFRNQNMTIEIQKHKEKYSIDEYIKSAEQKHIGGVLYIDNQQSVQIVDVFTKEVNKAELKDLMGEGR